MFKSIIMIFTLLITVGCQEGTPLSKEDTNPVRLSEIHLGPAYLDTINNAQTVTFSKVRPILPKDFKLEGDTIDLDRDDVAKLKEILLSDKSYLFNIQKKCVFVPEYALEFKLRGNAMLLLYAPTCKEFKVPYGRFKAQIIEIDPSYEQIEALLKKYKEKLEVSDENNTSNDD
jgi:hypothetical protein